jgi:site-specific recombinase
MTEDSGKDNFYRSQFFEQLQRDIAEIKRVQGEQAKDISAIKQKFSYMVGWAAGAGAIVAFICEYVKAYFFHQ